jgi:hypothetical protein
MQTSVLSGKTSPWKSHLFATKINANYQFSNERLKVIHNFKYCCRITVCVEQGSQTQILSRAALPIKNVPRAAH